MITLTLTPTNWLESTGQVHRRNAEGYPLAPQSFVLAHAAQQNDLIPELTAVLEYFIGAGTAENWVLTNLQARQVATVQDTDEDGEPSGDPRPVLELSCTFVAREEHPDYANISGPRYDTLNSESLPEAVRDALCKFYEALMPA